MNILVCMKAVPSTGQVQVDGQFKLLRDGAKLEWNVADQAALEAALQLKGTDGTVTVITMGPAKLEEAMRELMARGADRAILLSDPAFAGADTFSTANTLSAAIQKIGSFDLILCGRRAIDGETGQVPAMLACSLGIPCINNAEKITISGDMLNIERRLEDISQCLRLPYPAMITICEYTYSLRLPGIMGMRKAKEKTINIMRFPDLSIDISQCGLKGSLTKVIAMDRKFPGLRKGPKESNVSIGVSDILALIKEAAR